MRRTQPDRISYISAARVIGILLVVFGHSYPFDVPIPGFLDQVRNFVYSFHMPLFVLISGYLAARSGKTGGLYIANRAKKLLIPYFVLSAAAFFPKALVQGYLNDAVEISWGYFLKSELIPRANVWGHFWFIPMIFAFGVLSALLGREMKNRKWLQGLLLAGAYVLLWLPKTTDWFALEDMRKNLFWYLLGFSLADGKLLEKLLDSKMMFLAFPAALVLFCLGAEVRVLVALLMILWVFRVGNVLPVHGSRLWKQVERHSFTIFLLSWPVQAVVEVVLNKILHLPVAVTMLGMFAAGTVVPLVCVNILNLLKENRCVRWLKLALGM